MDKHPQSVKRYLDRQYRPERRRYECRAGTRREFEAWQNAARGALAQLLQLPLIEEEARGHFPKVDLSEDGEDMGDYFRREGWIETEPDVRIPIWLLRPNGDGPFPLAVTPHGHGEGDAYAGIWHDEKTRRRIETMDLDVAVQAVTRGYLTIVPATRGIGNNPKSFRIADIADRHDGRDCRCHAWQVIASGRTMMGERVWDLMRILDWAIALPDVRNHGALMVGNSGGGMATLHTAAVDERVAVAVPCCAYSNYISPFGTLRHCPCNTLPGILGFGEFWDVAGLVAPRPMLTVNGTRDSLHPVEEVESAVARLEKIYRAADADERYEHRFGPGGHRFYADLMWPWIDRAVSRMSHRLEAE